MESSMSHRCLASFQKGQGSRPLPSTTAWRAWLENQYMGWCGRQVDSFAEAIEQALRDSSRQAAIKNDPRFAKANRILAFEPTSMLNATTVLYVNSVDTA